MTLPTTRRSFLGALMIGAALGLVACAPPPAARLRMACGEPGGTYIRFGELLRTSLRGSAEIASLEVLATAGSRENIDLITSGEAEIAIALADAMDVADAGVVAIGRVYQNYVQCIVRSDSPIVELEQLRGRAVSLGASGSGTAHTARRLLEVAGLADDVDGIEYRLADAVDALARGAIDALFWSGGIPLPALDALPERVRPRVLDLGAVFDPLSTRFPGVYHLTEIPAGVYGSAEPVPAIGVSNLLLVDERMPAAIVSTLVDHLIDDARRLVPDPSVGVQFLTPSNLIDTAGVTLHPAAAERYAQRYG